MRRGGDGQEKNTGVRTGDVTNRVPRRLWRFGTGHPRGAVRLLAGGLQAAVQSAPEVPERGEARGQPQRLWRSGDCQPRWSMASETAGMSSARAPQVSRTKRARVWPQESDEPPVTLHTTKQALTFVYWCIYSFGEC